MQMEDFHDTDEMDMSDDSQDFPRNNKRFKIDMQHQQVRIFLILLCFTYATPSWKPSTKQKVFNFTCVDAWSWTFHALSMESGFRVIIDNKIHTKSGLFNFSSLVM